MGLPRICQECVSIPSGALGIIDDEGMAALQPGLAERR
jgi:hypothetical protein